jgi:hypothetical protein
VFQKNILNQLIFHFCSPGKNIDTQEGDRSDCQSKNASDDRKKTGIQIFKPSSESSG